MKIVIVGAGRVGYAIAEQLLTEGHDITVVESDPERAAYISSTLDVIVVEGRANVDQLRIANVADADLLIAATTSDETNLISCMVGRKLGATHTIARVRDEEYYQDVVLLHTALPGRHEGRAVCQRPCGARGVQAARGQQARRTAPERFPRPLQRRYPYLRRGARGRNLRRRILLRWQRRSHPTRR